MMMLMIPAHFSVPWSVRPLSVVCHLSFVCHIHAACLNPLTDLDAIW